MSEFKHVTIVKAANVYFDGGVTSRTVIFPDGSKKTLGIIQPGEYTFNTDAAEMMEIISGSLDVKIGDEPWGAVQGGESFKVPAKSSFTMKVKSLTDYCCSFLD
jgi:uncharacterized protein YaiE (UPF0345 family)